MTQRTWWLLAGLAVVLIGALFYFFHDFNTETPTNPNPFSFVGLVPTSTPSKVTGPGKPSTPITPSQPTKTVGYSISIHGKAESITSTSAGVTVDAPVNSVVSQTNAILSVTPPESTAGEMLQLQKSTAGFADPLAGVRSSINGTANAFNALRTAEDSTEFNPGSVAQPSHVVKVHNTTVDGVAAVTVHVKNAATGTTAARDFFLTWVHTGSTNWYIVRTGAGLTPGAASSLDSMMSSIKLIQ